MKTANMPITFALLSVVKAHRCTLSQVTACYMGGYLPTSMFQGRFGKRDKLGRLQFRKIVH